MKTIELDFSFRKWQREVKDELKRFSVLVVHRQAGKTWFAVSHLIEKVFSIPVDPLKITKVAYIAPTKTQAEKIMWPLLKALLKPLPGVSFHGSKLVATFPNGAELHVLGADNPDAIRGLYLHSVVLDEVADMPEGFFEAIVRPMLVSTKGDVIFIGTPKGKNKFFEYYKRGGKRNFPDWVSFLYKWDDTNALDEDEVQSLREEMGEDLFDQEMNCSFTATVKGAVFSKYITEAEKYRRIGIVTWDPDLPVVAGFDIGLDGTAVWYGQATGGEIRLIDYDFWEDKDLIEVIPLLQNKPYAFDLMILPHDAKKRSYLNKKMSPLTELKKYFKVRCLKIPKKEEAVLATKKILRKCIFDAENCEEGVECLRNYSFKVDRFLGTTTSTEIHDKFSHGASAFMTLVAGLKTHEVQEGTFTGGAYSERERIVGKQKKNTLKKYRPFKRRDQR